MKCEINLTQNIKEQVTNCVEKVATGPSPSGSKSYICKYNCKKNLRTSKSNQNIFIERILIKLEHIKKNDEALENCEIEISIGPAPIQKKSKSPGM